MTSTRDQILNLLKRNNQLTVSVIAQELNITEMAVRRHLNTLERDGIVETTLHRQAMGRPTNIYHLSNLGQEMFPRNYDEFTINILQDIEELVGDDKVRELFEKRRDRLKERYARKLNMSDFEERVMELARIHNEQGYMTEVEKEEDGTFIFKEFNCPVAEVAKKFPALCKTEIELFKEVLQTDHVVCEYCLPSSEDAHCQFKIKEMK